MQAGEIQQVVGLKQNRELGQAEAGVRLSSNSDIVVCTDSIESNVETAAVDVRQGAVELSKAKDYQVLLLTHTHS